MAQAHISSVDDDGFQLEHFSFFLPFLILFFCPSPFLILFVWTDLALHHPKLNSATCARFSVFPFRGFLRHEHGISFLQHGELSTWRQITTHWLSRKSRVEAHSFIFLLKAYSSVNRTGKWRFGEKAVRRMSQKQNRIRQKEQQD